MINLITPGLCYFIPHTKNIDVLHFCCVLMCFVLCVIVVPNSEMIKANDFGPSYIFILFSSVISFEVFLEN